MFRYETWKRGYEYLQDPKHYTLLFDKEEEASFLKFKHSRESPWVIRIPIVSFPLFTLYSLLSEIIVAGYDISLVINNIS